MDRISRERISDILLSRNEGTRGEFLKTFGSEINVFIDGLSQVYERLSDLGKELPKEKRAAWVRMFLLSSFDSLLASFHLLISGFLNPAGSLMHNWAEALAMALLCSDERIDAFDRFRANPAQFPVHRAPDILRRRDNARILNIDPEGWATFREINNYFDKYSYAFALANLNPFSQDGQRPFGSQVDAEKVNEYREEIDLRISACERLLESIGVAKTHLALTPKA